MRAFIARPFWRILAVVLLALTLAGGFMAASPSGAGAYPGETDGVVWFNLSAPGRGCYGTLLVLYYRAVTVGCIMQSNDGSYTWVKWGPYFSCYQPNGCYVSFNILGAGQGYRPEGVITERMDDYGGTHAIITSAGSH